ncbi:MAG: IS256 family transposase [Myxococcota bacterium]
MKKVTPIEEGPSRVVWEELEKRVREHAQEWIQRLLEEEVESFLGRRKSERRACVDGRAGYRNGHGKPRRLSMMSGTITVRRPRVRATEDPFESRVLPLFVRRTESVRDLLPELYLHGLSQGAFELAMRGLLGEGAPLSASSIARLRGRWQAEYEAWAERSLADHDVVYAWADGIYVKAGLEKEKAALLVVVGALRDGRKEVLAVVPGHRESEAAWTEVLRDLAQRGLRPPRLLVADGALGIWAAAAHVWPTTEEQRCWNHKIANVLDKLPKNAQATARELLRKIPAAETRKEAEQRREAFVRRYQRTQPKAVETLLSDWERMVTFYRFPKEHWKHLRTTNVVESPFAAVRLRTDAAKRFKRVDNATAMLWKLLRVAEKTFRLLDHAALLRDVYAGRTYRDGVIEPVSKSEDRAAA